MIVDETGLFKLSARDLLAGLRSSVSARGGQIRHISIRGDSPLFAEILENPAVVSHVHASPDNCAIDDEAAWHAANPGLGTIKSLAYMRDEVACVAGVASDEPSFRSYDLNQALSPTLEMVCTPDDLEACFVAEATYAGPCYLGIDIGESSAGSAAVAYWPETGGLQSWLAFGDMPDLAARGRRGRCRLCRHGAARRAADLSGARGSGWGIRGQPWKRTSSGANVIHRGGGRIQGGGITGLLPLAA